MRVVAGVFAAVFLLSAAVQWNDPDPLRWICAYLVAAVLSITAAMGRTLLIPNAAAAAVFAAWFLSLAPTIGSADPEAFTSFQMKDVSHEEPREAMGLALCAVWTAVLAGFAWRAKHHCEHRA
ncbi:MAG: transmembrane 220 family protein [Myxococcales bacterium]|nr:transmembrane 220 family protein [Myxococcales bacterium]